MYWPVSIFAKNPPRIKLEFSICQSALRRSRLEQLVTAATTTTAAASTSRTPAGIPAATAASSAATAGSIPTTATAKLLWARFVHLQRPAFHIQAVQLPDRFGCFVLSRELNESESPRPSGFAVGDDSSGTHLVSLLAE